MDGEQPKFQFLGFFGIFREAFNIITSHRKIFSQITLSVILPLSFIYIAQNEFSEFFLGKITPDDNNVMDDPQMGFQDNSMTSDHIFSTGGGGTTTFWLFTIAFSICSIILSLFSTSAVVYTIACIYTAKEITYTKVMKVVPKVWKRLMITFLWIFLISIALIIVAALIIITCFFWVVTLQPSGTVSVIAFAVAIIISLIYLSGVVYLSFVWQLANVISVLENVYGLQAMVKSKNLVKGNTRICAAIILTMSICYLGIGQGYKASVVCIDSVWGKILLACLWSMIMSMLTLFGLVTQTIIYFICKSYHHEDTDKSSLADHLEVYRDDYIKLNTKDVHDEQQSMV